MVRFNQLLALIIIACSTVAYGQIVTNDVTTLPTRHWSTGVGAPWYLRVYAVQGSTPIDLTERRVVWTIRHSDTEALILSSTGTIHDAATGQIIFRWTPTAAATYRSLATITRVDTGEATATILDDVLTVTSALPNITGGGGTVTNLLTLELGMTLTSTPPQITLVTTQIFPTTYISTSAGVFRVTSTNGTVTVNTNEEGTVDLGVVPAQDVALTASTNGVTLGSFDTLNTGPGILGELSTSGVFTLSLEAYQWPGAAAGTNRQAFPYVANTSQWWQVPSGVTSIYVWVWGGGSVGVTVSPAGFTPAEVPVQPLEWLELQVGQGGQCVTCYTAAVQTDSAFPNGGRGVCRLGAGSGGYSTGGGAWGAVLRTGMVLVAAGGASGTGQGSSVVYAGGGRVGRGRQNVGDATGGTQTNGGLAATSSGVVLITNGAGQFMMGGQGGMVTNLGHGAGGGGGGYFGGGGGFSDGGTLRAAAGGSGFVNVEQGCVGETYSAYTGTYPVGFDLPEYAMAGTPGYSGTTTSMGSRGGNAGIVIGWQAPP